MIKTVLVDCLGVKTQVNHQVTATDRAAVSATSFLFPLVAFLLIVIVVGLFRCFLFCMGMRMYLRMSLWWSLCTLCLLACQMRVTVGGSDQSLSAVAFVGCLLRAA